METSSKSQPVSVQPLDHALLGQALGLSQALHWPYRLEDWAFALELGHGLAVVRDGQLCGTALWWPYGDDVAAIGMIIVAEQAQRQGIGAALMGELLRQTAGRCRVLNSTEEGYALYARLGFVPYGAVHQHQAVLGPAPEPAKDWRIRDPQAADWPILRALDRDASAMERDNLVGALAAVGAFQVIERAGAVCGYGCRRAWGRGWVIGPVVAPDAEAAQALIAALAQGLEGAFVRIDVPRASGLSPWLEAIGLPQVGAVTAMSLGPPPESRGEARLFALSNQSLG
ncbi:GNAT family N-acetyltransferase [Novosphingobium sp. 1949]|uniref:GNAT family N-acetyltransferase n=1 Tax=Novosphingobium organovorum TaxID=2930092 RepID=A0ABT0BDR5_9SPHN|nr:GNAT family N-acetyltransferase [Novosphingobium organovorum]MCJ2182939.1 GNAT family N-acetyltransferase [Novosphingobium organovorum]